MHRKSKTVSLENSGNGLGPCMGSIQHMYTYLLQEILPKYLGNLAL